MTAPEDFQVGEWLRAEGPDADIAICSRARLARNLRGHRFAPMMDEDEAGAVTGSVSAGLRELTCDDTLQCFDLGELALLERTVLVERHLISREHANAERTRAVAINGPESLSIMINEEDHLRSQVFRSGLRLDECFETGREIDREIARILPLAFSEEFGYLTSCPTNAGTGLRLSVMLHLPALVWAEEIEKATHTVQKISLAVRGLYGEGSRALGDFYQVSNQVTLGRSEGQLLKEVGQAVGRLIEWERNMRQALLRGTKKIGTLDRIYRALGTLRNARVLTSEEALTCLSAVRLGVHEELLDGPDILSLNRALLLTQPAHLQRMHGAALDPASRDEHRATLVRSLLTR